MRIAVDWDDTLVDVTTKEWLPGAVQAIRGLLAAGNKVIVHSCRANWPEGLREIQAKLASERLVLDVFGKPSADVYVDDRAFRFQGWAEATNELHARALRVRLRKAAEAKQRLRTGTRKR